MVVRAKIKEGLKVITKKTPEPTEQEKVMAVYIAEHICGTPGCIAKYHFADAQALFLIAHKEVES